MKMSVPGGPWRAALVVVLSFVSAGRAGYVATTTFSADSALTSAPANTEGTGFAAGSSWQVATSGGTRTSGADVTPLTVGSVSGGNEALFLSGAGAVTRALPSSGDTILTSLLFRYLNPTQVRNDFLAIVLAQPGVTGSLTNLPSFGLKVNQDSPTATNDFFVRFTNGQEQYASLDLTSGRDYLLTAVLSKTGGSATYNRFELTVTDGTTTATAVKTGNSGISTIGTVGIRTSGLAGGAYLDELNVTAVPVPAGIVLAAMGVGPLLGFQFLRRRKAA